MKTIKMVCAFLAFCMLYGCGVPQEDYDKLQSENKILKAQVEEYKYGAERLTAEVEKAYAEKNYGLARDKINTLSEKHPQSSKNEEFKELLVLIDTEEIEAREEEERDRLVNHNSTGIWLVSYYEDVFGNPTADGFIRNKALIQGKFSNTATEDSKLDVKLLIVNEFDISLMLYEYASNYPVKAYGTAAYTVLVQDKDGERLRLTAYGRSDRLSLGKTDSQKVHQALMKGGRVSFKVERDTPTTEYSFNIQNTDGYNNAYRILSES
ncbi:MAG: hypothetical protein HOJ88_06015 [Proteobacteria bacterium]|jgi:hypothetical protein|nr:hypothetical protein [Pseudomonadota bacterium]